MKATAMRSYNYYANRHPAPSRYPNAVRRRFSVQKLVDLLLAAVITVAVVAILMFLLALG